MTHLSPAELDHLTTGQLSVADLTDAQLDHALECPDCSPALTAASSGQDAVATALATDPSPAIPADVVARLDAVIAAESRRRTSGAADREAAAAHAAHAKRFTLGTFGDNSPHRAPTPHKAIPREDRHRTSH
ncbi:hypothetical protein [Microlunatus sp. Y2014]|uniref:hypothetical protein n=1 Tax=Microlunatus sp. Y2014 TaxID=3418488 RepID=UPI003DA70142